MAIESERVTADGIEATEFPALSSQYRVHAVPKTVINGQSFIEGSLPESFFIDAILKELGITEEL